jgi:uncharacterized membrane protein YhaH (DUF805 family)
MPKNADAMEGELMHWYLEALKKYATFSGRARRTEFWIFWLINFVIAIILAIIDVFVLDQAVLSGPYSLAVLLPTLAVTVRRFHDMDRKGWWLLIALFPGIGIVIALLFLVPDGTPGPNRYGPSPKEIPA